MSTTATAVLFVLMASVFVSAPASAAATYTFYVSGTSVGETSPGTTKDYTLNLTNLNASAAISFNLSISASPIGWTTQLSASAVTVGASATRQITLSVKPPSGALYDNVGQYVNVTATPDDNTAAQTASTTTRVSEVLGVSLTVTATGGTAGDPGQNITWNAYLKNTGNSAQTYTVALNNTSFTSTNLTSNLVTVSPGDTRAILITINISTSAQVGTLFSAISATSNANSSVKDAMTFSASVNAKRAVALSGLTSDDLIGQTESESSITFRNVLVDNRGNVADSYTLQGTANLSRHGDWVSFQTPTFSLSAFTQRYINVTVTVPASVTATGDYTVEFRIISDNSTAVIAFLNLTVTVVAKHDLKMVYESLVAKQSGDPGTTVSFPINVSNPGAYDDTVQINYSGPNSAWVTISASLFTLAPGAFKIVFANFSIPGTQSPTSFAFQVLGTTNWSNPYRNRTVDLTLEVRQVYDVRASTSASAGSGLPGASVVFNVTITNNGTGADNFTITATNATQSGVLTLSTTSIFLNGGASQTITATVAISNSPVPSAGVYYYTVSAKSSGNVSRISSVDLALTVRQVYAVSATVTPAYQAVDPGATTSFTVSVTNDGNGPDTIALQRAGVNQSWLGFPVGSATIASGGRMNFTVQVTTPSSAAEGDTLLTVKAVSGGDANISDAPTFTVSVNPFYGVVVTASTSSITDAHRNSSYVVTVTLRNAGNQADTYAIAIGGADAGWASVPSPSYALNANQNQSFAVTVQTPSEPANGAHAFTVTATSLGKPTLVVSIGFNVTINDVLRPEVRLPQTSFFALPYENKSIAFTVKNNGTIADTLLVYGVAHFPAEKYYNASIALLPGQSANRTFVVFADYPYSGLYTVELTVTSTVNSSFEARATAAITLEVARSLDLQGPTDPTLGGPLGLYTFNLSLRNTGNISDTYTLSSLAPTGWIVTLSDASFSLAPNAIANFTATLQAPSPLAAGTYTASVAATSGTVASLSDSASVRVAVSYGVSLTGTSTGAQLLPGGTHAFTAVVQNTGTADGDFRLLLLGQVATWASATPSVLTLGAGQSTTVQVDVTVPLTEHEGIRTFTLQAASLADASKTSNLGFSVTVNQRFAFSVAGPLTPISTLPGQTATFLLTLTNTGNGNDSFIFVANPPQNTAFSPDNVRIDALQTVNVSVLYTPVSGASVGTQPIRVTVYGTNGQADVFLNATILPSYNITARGVPSDPITAVVSPNATVTVNFEVANRGNGIDTISWSLTGAASAWANATAGALTLPPGSSAPVSIEFAVPAFPLPPAGLSPLQFSAESTLGGSATRRTVNGTLEVGEAPLLKIALDETGTTPSFTRNLDRANPGTVNFTVWIFNNGNRNETVTLTRAPPTGWSVTINGSSSAVFVIPPGGVATAAVRIASFPASATDGQVVISARGADAKVAESTVTYGIHFERGIPRIEGTPTLSQQSVAARSSVTVTFTVVNDGDGTATSIPIELKVDGTRVVASDTIASIAPHGRTTVSLTWVTSDGDAGTRSLSAGISGQSPAQAGDVAVTGGQKTLTALIVSDRNTQTALAMGLVLGLVLGFAMFYRRRKAGPTPMPVAVAGPPGSDSALAGVAALELEGSESAAQEQAPAPPPSVEHKVVCPECGTEQWIRGAEGECTNCGVVIEVAEDPGALPE